MVPPLSEQESGAFSALSPVFAHCSLLFSLHLSPWVTANGSRHILIIVDVCALARRFYGFTSPASTVPYLPIFEVLLQLPLHGGQLLGLHSAVGQQHATKLPLSDSSIHRVMAFKLGGKETECLWD